MVWPALTAIADRWRERGGMKTLRNFAGRVLTRLATCTIFHPYRQML
jgi:hypothetical protein